MKAVVYEGPRPIGHENLGEVVEAGAGVVRVDRAAHGFAIG